MSRKPRPTPLFAELSSLVTEGALPESSQIDLAETPEVLRVIHAEDRRVPAAVEACLSEIAQVVDAVVTSFDRGGRLLYVGAGTSGRLGILDAAECPPTFGTDPREVVGVIAGGAESVFRAQEGAEDDAVAGGASMDEHSVEARDTVVGIAASRRTPFVLGALSRARELGAGTALVTCNPGGDAQDAADVLIAPVVGPEVISGSTRMKAGTATKLVLNMITTAAMIRRGKTLGNLMVDLRPGSEKLIERSRRIVMEVAGVGYEEAAGLLQDAEGSVKVAIVMGVASVGLAEAKERLARAGGFVRRAMEA
ncbi:MAG: N-acetylmuramic acid 6-phosphate etherase [Gemmatimonadota bacterium]|nr:N-acetylmuramic acid 6-phosphate etherase [Gemmatimonadota bacterium]MDP6529571.1 N-acetylmuramic acid 6-phosphate etherase [Gemmatimonadota bacterium]